MHSILVPDLMARTCGMEKPAAVVSVSIGGISGFGANHHLRQSLVFLNVPTMPQPEAYIGNATALFDAGGSLVNEGTREFLQKFMDAFSAWVQTFAPTKTLKGENVSK